MRDLSTLAAELLATPLCRTPPVHEVAARARLLRRRRRLVAAGLVVIGAAAGKEFVVPTVKSPHL